MIRRPAVLLVVLLALTLALAALSPCGGAPPGDFEFVIPGLDATRIAARGQLSITGLHGLREEPFTGVVHAVDGKLVDGDGRRLRLLGVNFSFGANFPGHDDADRVAAHLAKLGINAVRHHHMDARDIWRRRPDGTRELDPEKLDRLAYLIAALARNGIYSDINLHVSRQATEAEGVQDAAALPAYDKYALYLDARLGELLREYARGVLGYKSPYTGRRLADEPSLVTVEITNENRFARAGLGPLAKLPERLQREFARRWNRWLRSRYGTTEALRAAWSNEIEPLGEDLLQPADFSSGAGPWRLHVQAASAATVVTGDPGPQPGVAAARVAIERTSGASWHIELSQGGLSVERGRIYTVSFWIRARAPRQVYADVSRSSDPWEPVGFREEIEVTADWRRFERSFRATATLERGARCIFKLGGATGDVWVAAPHVRRGGSLAPPLADDAVETDSVPVPEADGSGAAQRDIESFMRSVELEFFADFHRFLREEVGVRAPITGSQARWASAESFAALDLVDAHAYWQHPSFPHRAWDPADWRIGNTPMVAVPGHDALTRLAWQRQWGRPFTVSEYNHPAPSDFQVECVPLLAAIASLQDWDGVYIYSYQHGGSDWNRDRITSFFDINGNPAKLALLPAAAMLFRRGDVTPPHRSVSRDVDEEGPGIECMDALVGTALEKGTSGGSPSAPRSRASDQGGAAAAASERRQVTWTADPPDRARLLVDTPRSKLAVGFIANDTIAFDDVTFETGPATRGFGAIALSAVDGVPIARSRRLLLTTVARAENTGVVWNDERTSIGDRWGRGPTRVEIVALVVRMRSGGGRHWRAVALDGTGRPRPGVAVSLTRAAGGPLELHANPADKTVWYVIEGVD